MGRGQENLKKPVEPMDSRRLAQNTPTSLPKKLFGFVEQQKRRSVSEQMKYPLFSELQALVEQKLVSKRPHPKLPLYIYNYSASAQFMPLAEWTPAQCDARGLILDDAGEIIARPFRKFWNYEQVLHLIPASEPFTVWEKLDGSLGVVCNYDGQRVIATRGSFESDQAKWAAEHFNARYGDFRAVGGTFLFEIIYPDNRIVVDYSGREDVVLLAVMGSDGTDDDDEFANCGRFLKAHRFDGVDDFAIINSDPRFDGQEGFVIRWQSGFRAKVKADEYKRLHRLITQCSSRTIWELLRSGKGIQELVDRVPADFQSWVTEQAGVMRGAFDQKVNMARVKFDGAPPFEVRKDFAEYAKRQQHPSLLFSLLDGKDITDAAWKLVEPTWSTPFRREQEW